MATNKQAKPSTAGWAIAALALSIIVCAYITSLPKFHDASLFHKILAVIAGALVGAVCARIGDALRRAVRPNFVITNGGFFDLLFMKLFWAVGPQLIGLAIGVFVAESVVLG